MLSAERIRQEKKLRVAALSGEEAAWRELYDLTYAKLWAYVFWRCAGLPDVAEEVTQDTWLVAVRRLRDFDPAAGPFLAWLRGIAGNHLRNYFRSKRVRPRQWLADDSLATAGDDQERREQAECIARALAELPERSEAVLRAKYLELASVEQIAAEWGDTAKAIESLLSRAREAFRREYEKLAGIDIVVKDSKP
jgi:RNA polymerase sigma-70 factor, ECF subfamily